MYEDESFSRYNSKNKLYLYIRFCGLTCIEPAYHAVNAFAEYM